MQTLQPNNRIIHLSDDLRTKLRAIADYPLTIVSAPIGYGKTITVQKYFSHQDVNGWEKQPTVLWQTLLGDGSEGFWEDFIATFTHIDLDFYQAVKQFHLPLSSAEQRQFRRLFNDFCAKQNNKLIFVLDNIHLTICDDVSLFLHYFINIIPNDFHLVLIGRSRLFVTDADFRIHNVANYIMQEDLTLSQADITVCSRLYGVNLSKADVAYLHDLSAGWPVLIQINLAEQQRSKSFLPEIELFRILSGAFYDSLPERTKKFLLTISICDSFSMEQAEYLWGQEDAYTIFEGLQSENICIHCSDIKGYYRFSPVFAAYFEQQNRLLPHEELNELRNRLAQWYLRISQWPMARRIYYQIRNFDALMDVVEMRRFLVSHTVDEHEFISYYMDCPPDIRAKHPKAILTFARQLFALGYQQLASQICCEFEDLMKSQADMDEMTRQKLNGIYEVLLSYAHYNDFPKMLYHIQKADELLKHHEEPVVWPDIGINDNFSLLFMYHRCAGEMQNEIKMFSEYNRIYSELIGGRLNGAEHVLQAEAFFAMGDLQSTEIALYKAKLVGHKHDQWGIWVCIALLEMRIALMKGDWSTLKYLLGEVKALSGVNRRYRIVPTYDVLEILLYSKLGRPQMIPNTYQDIDIKIINRHLRCLPMLCCVHAEALLARGEATRLLALAEEYLHIVRLNPNLYAELILFIMFAGAYSLLGQKEKAAENLSIALKLAAPDKIITPFVEMFRHLDINLFSSVDKIFKREVDMIILRSQEYDRSIKKIVSEHFAFSDYGLTNRELEVARLAAARLSNKEISKRLSVQESTVKTQLAHVFSKLDIKNRKDLSLFFTDE